MKILERLDAALEKGLSKEVFDHLRNYLMCAFVLAIGASEIKESATLIFGLIPAKQTGYGVFAFAIILILLNLYDGIRKISKSRYHVLMTIALVSVYVFFSIRIVEMAWNFRINY